MPRSSLRRTLKRIVALSMAAVLASGAGLASAASASATMPTFTVTGVVPSGVRTGVEVYALVWAHYGFWQEKGKLVKPDPTTGKFTLQLPAGPNHYTLYFHTDRVPYFDTALGGGTAYPDEKSKYVFTGKAGSVKKVGQIPFIAAGVIEGTITGLNNNPIADAEVAAGATVPSGDGYFEGTTDDKGRYYLTVDKNGSVRFLV